MFVFQVTNASTEDLKVPYMSDNCMSCFCVWFNDLQIYKGELYKVQKAICVSTTNQQFGGLIQEMLSCIVQIHRGLRAQMQVLKHLSEVESATQYPLELLSVNEQAVLTDVYEYIKKQPKGVIIGNVEI